MKFNSNPPNIVDYLDIAPKITNGDHKTIVLDTIRDIAKKFKMAIVTAQQYPMLDCSTFANSEFGSLSESAFPPFKSKKMYVVNSLQLLASYFEELSKSQAICKMSMPNSYEQWLMTNGFWGTSTPDTFTLPLVYDFDVETHRKIWTIKAVQDQKAKFGNLFSKGDVLNFFHSVEGCQIENGNKTERPTFDEVAQVLRYGVNGSSYKYRFCYKGDTALVLDEYLLTNFSSTNKKYKESFDINFIRCIELLVTKQSNFNAETDFIIMNAPQKIYFFTNPSSSLQEGNENIFEVIYSKQSLNMKNSSQRVMIKNNEL